MQPSVLCNFVWGLASLVTAANSQTDIVSLHGTNWTVVGRDGIKRRAVVPGGIYTDLLRSGEIGDPYYRFNDKLYRWIGQEDWTYRLHFQTPGKILEKQIVSLILEGVDTVSMVTVNGKALGHTNNMFMRYIWNVKPLLQPDWNTIEVALESPVKTAERFASSYPYPVPPECSPQEAHGECHVNFLRKEQSSFSWDWGPSFPSVGIWKNISIQASDGPTIEDIMVIPQIDASTSKWTLNITVCTQSSYMDVLSKFIGKLNINLAELSVNYTSNVSFDRQHLCIPAVINIKKSVQLWWPNGYGSQKLYNLTATLTSENGVILSSKSRNFGFRSVQLVQEPVSSNNSDGLTFLVSINGREIFMKGSNWIPADSFQERISEQYLRSLLESARDAHMNMLRVWGGGVYESDMFYNIADEYGITIWQDLMFACAMYPVDVNFLKNVEEEVTYQIRRLIHHPSIILWAGSNENEAALRDDWYNTYSNYNLYYKDFISLYIYTIKPIVEREDGSRPFVSSSPSNGVESEKEGWVASNPYSEYYGDVHFYDYGMDSWNAMRYPVPRFMSEYGFQSWPSFASIQNVSEPGDWSLNSSFVDYRQHHLDGNKQLVDEVSLHLRLPNTSNSTEYFINFIYLTQINQAMGIKTETEVYLRSQSKVVQGRGRTMGALYWQLNDIWQAPTWASLEYGGKWKMLHYYAKNFFSPRIISSYTNDSDVVVYFINQNNEKQRPKQVLSKSTMENMIFKESSNEESVNIQMTLYSWDSMTARKSWVYQVPKSTDAATQVTSRPVNDLLSEGSCLATECFLYFKTLNAPDVPPTFLLLSYFPSAKGLKKPNYQVSVAQVDQNTFNVTLKVDAVTPFIWLDVTGTRGRFSDNGFLQVELVVNVLFFAWEDVDLAAVQKKITVQSLMDIY